MFICILKWFAMGLSTDDPDRFQGHHAEHLLLVMDEAPSDWDDITRALATYKTAKKRALEKHKDN